VSISQEDLFKIALNLENPWYITLIDFSAEGKQLDIHVDFESGNKFPCAKCGKSSCSVHDTIKRTWRHLNFFQFKTYIHCRVPRTECEDCGVKQVKVPWARKGSGFTLLMDSLIVLMAQHITVTAIAEMIDEHSCFQYLITSNISLSPLTSSSSSSPFLLRDPPPEVLSSRSKLRSIDSGQEIEPNLGKELSHPRIDIERKIPNAGERCSLKK